MCTYLLYENQCELKTRLADGSRYDPQIAAVINSEFKRLAEERDKFNNDPLGYGCGGPKCCYTQNKLVSVIDCPYFS